MVVYDMAERRSWPKSDPTLLVGNGGDIRQLNAVTGHQAVTCDVEVGRAVAVDFDNANNAVFWTDVRNQNITRSTADVFTIAHAILAGIQTKWFRGAPVPLPSIS